MAHTNPTRFVVVDSEIEWMIHRILREATKGSTSRVIDIEDKESFTMAV